MKLRNKTRFFYSLATFLSSYSFVNATDGTGFPLNDLPRELKLSVMKQRFLDVPTQRFVGIIKSLYCVNHGFYDLAHDSELADIIQHTLPDSQAFAQIQWFLPKVNVTFQASPLELSRLQKVCILDVSAVNLDNAGAQALDNIPTLAQLTLGSAHPNDYYDYACNPRNKAVKGVFLRLILKDPAYPNRFGVIQNLLWSEEKEDKKQAISALTVIMQNQTNPNSLDAARSLLNSNVEDSKRAAAEVIRNSIKKPTDPTHFYDIQSVYYSGTQESKRVAAGFLREIMQDKGHPNRLDAARLFSYSNNEEDKNAGTAILRESMQDQADLNNFSGAQHLLHSGNEEDKSAALSFLRKVMGDKNNVHHFSAAQSLSHSGKAEDREKATLILRDVMQDKTNPNYFDAVRSLLYSDNEEMRSAALSLVKEIAKDKENPRYQEAIEILARSGDKEDKERALEILFDPTQEKQALVKKLQQTGKYHIYSPAHARKIRQLAKILINDEALDIEDTLGLLQWVEKQDIAKGTASRMLSAIGSEAPISLSPHLIATALEAVLDCSYPDLQQSADSLFLDNPSKYITAYSEMRNDALQDTLAGFTEERKNKWLEKICDFFRSSAVDSTQRFRLACIVLNLSDRPEFVAAAQDVIRGKLNANEESLVELVSGSFLNHLTETELKKEVVSMLESVAQKIVLTDSPFRSSAYKKVKALGALLKQNDKAIKENALALCQKLVDSMQGEHKNRSGYLGQIGFQLAKIDEGMSLAQKIYTLLQPDFKKALSAPIDKFYKHTDVLKFLLKMGDGEQKSAVYKFCCKVIAETDDEDDIEDAAKIITKIMGNNHPWSKEATTLMEKRKLSE